MTPENETALAQQVTDLSQSFERHKGIMYQKLNDISASITEIKTMVEGPEGSAIHGGMVSAIEENRQEIEKLRRECASRHNSNSTGAMASFGVADVKGLPKWGVAVIMGVILILWFLGKTAGIWP